MGFLNWHSCTLGEQFSLRGLYHWRSSVYVQINFRLLCLFNNCYWLLKIWLLTCPDIKIIFILIWIFNVLPNFRLKLLLKSIFPISFHLIGRFKWIFRHWSLLYNHRLLQLFRLINKFNVLLHNFLLDNFSL